jgi:hypothetical protein
MWSHYAAAHTGICLEFDASAAPFTRQTGATKIKYLETYPKVDLVGSNHESLLLKSAHWAYEAEWRLIAEEREWAEKQAPNPYGMLITEGDFFTFPEGVLKSVTIGCRADISSRDLIYRVVGTHAPDVIVRQTSLARDRYELTVDPSYALPARTDLNGPAQARRHARRRRTERRDA